MERVRERERTCFSLCVSTGFDLGPTGALLSSYAPVAESFYTGMTACTVNDTIVLYRYTL